MSKCSKRDAAIGYVMSSVFGCAVAVDIIHIRDYATTVIGLELATLLTFGVCDNVLAADLIGSSVAIDAFK